MTDLANLNHLGREADRGLIGTRCHGAAGFAIDGVNAENVETANAFDYSINGIMYSNAADAEIDISAEIASLPADLADGNEQIYVFCIDSAGAYYVIAGDVVANADIDAGTKNSHWPEGGGDDMCAFAAVKVKNASGADFILGTTALSAAGITDTYYDLAVIPANTPV